MTEQPTEYVWVEPKAQHEIDILLAASFEGVGLPGCANCGAVTESPDTVQCIPCARHNRGNWVPHPTVRPRAAVFADGPQTRQEAQDGPSVAFWQEQAEAYAADLATLNARGVRWRGLLAACLPHVPAPLRAHIERELAG